MSQAPAHRRTISITLDAAYAPGLNFSALADAALRRAVAEARQKEWRTTNAAAFAAQARWYETHGHPLSEIIAGSAPDAWKP
ncbi:type II toxin-antitoxin system CcdA family antitoxin [Primorskyibacter sp. 2E107]|uniref:type II toxin-antitoxin system CcdA family antitoxin n=1 Tax=Primorskyibacter sp. 2E107 TaxID=3403458 RepID=UPI003AF87770